MEKQEIYKTLVEKLSSKSDIKLDEPMKMHTNFRIGGNADIFIISKEITDIQKIVQIANENNIPLTLLGNGSNVLVADKGIRGIVLKIAMEELKIQKEGENAHIEVEAGMPLGKLAQIFLKEQIAGFEFASGIPGVIGGATYMNAGAYGGELSNYILNVTYIDEKGNLLTRSKEECNFSYRHSWFCENFGIIVKVKEKIEEYTNSRKEKQPINLPSAGSVFKRGEDFIPAKLIDDCGLKGFQIGGAQVSNMHAGFIVNVGNASAKNVLEVIEYVKQKVYENTGKKIELEVKLLGEF